MNTPEKQPNLENTKEKIIKIGSQVVKSAEQMLAEYTGNDE